MKPPTIFLFLLLVSPAAYAVQHIVGDSLGWTSTGDYGTWSEGKTFTVGDTLVFNYDSSHKVDVVNENDYDQCVSGNALKSYNDGSTTITLDKAGPMYFICPTIGHCAGGMKLSIDVVAAGTPGGGSPPTTPSPPSGSGTPPATVSSPPPPPSGGAGTSRNMNNVMIGLSLAFGIGLAYVA